MSTDYTTSVTVNNSSGSQVLIWIIFIILAIAVFFLWKWWRKNRFYQELENSNELAFLKVIMPREQKGEEDQKKIFVNF